jgi:sulfate adenylyltransferase subunit 2
MLIMTNNYNIDNLITHMHSSNNLWDIKTAYEKSCIDGYFKSKRSFERELQDLGFIPFQEQVLNQSNIIKLVHSYWMKLVTKKRYLSLKATCGSYNKMQFIFFEDSRGKKYWYPLHALEDTFIKKSLNALSNYSNKSIIIWPSINLIKIFKFIVDENGSESQAFQNNNKIILPVSAYKMMLDESDLGINNPTLISKKKKNTLTHLEKIEAEAIHIIRETISEASNPVMLYSVGKDSAVLLHLVKKSFYPASPPFPLLHVDTGWKFNEMYQFRDLISKNAGMDLIVFKNVDGVNKNINPFDHGSEIHTDVMKTQALKMALDKYKFDFAFGGARRDEEKSRAKERILSFRSESHSWDPKNQRPELWDIYNFNKMDNESARVFPISNWTELDIWQYIYKESIPIVPLYFAAERPFIKRNGNLLMVDDDRFKLQKGEEIQMIKARFRTLGCYPLTAAVESTSNSIDKVLLELIESKTTERGGRLIDSDSEGSMEKKKKEGYF